MVFLLLNIFVGFVIASKRIHPLAERENARVNLVELRNHRYFDEHTQHSNRSVAIE